MKIYRKLRKTKFTNVKLKWFGPFYIEDIDGIPELEELDGVYMFLDGWEGKSEKWHYNNILYIGMTYHQTFKKRLKQDLRNKECLECFDSNTEDDLLFKIGLFTGGNWERITQQLVRDTESLFIISHQPLCNIQSTETYKRRKLIIANFGEYEPFIKKFST